MRRCFLAGILIVSAAMPSAAQWLKHPDARIPRTADGKPNLTAPAPRFLMADRFSRTSERDRRPFPDEHQPPRRRRSAFSTVGEKLFDERQANQGRDRPAGFCLPHGVPDAMLVPNYPWKVVQTPGLTIILYENFTDFRQIFTDGRSHPVERGPTWFGYSIGRFDADTFVVESVGFNGKTWLDDGGHPLSEEMKITERFRRKDFGHLEVEFTFDDPKTYEAVERDGAVRTPARYGHHRKHRGGMNWTSSG